MQPVRPKCARLRLDPKLYEQLHNQVLRRDGWRRYSVRFLLGIVAGLAAKFFVGTSRFDIVPHDLQLPRQHTLRLKSSCLHHRREGWVFAFTTANRGRGLRGG